MSLWAKVFWLHFDAPYLNAQNQLFVPSGEPKIFGQDAKNCCNCDGCETRGRVDKVALC